MIFRPAVVPTALALAAAAPLQADIVSRDTGPAGSGAPISLYQPSLALTPVVVKNSDFDEVGEVFWFAGGFAPAGTRPADGRLLDLSTPTNQSLATKIGTSYGGDGVSTFALPDLRGRGIVGRNFANSRFTGELRGSPSITLGLADMPNHVHEVPATGEDTFFAGGSRAQEVKMPTMALTTTTPRLGNLPGSSVSPGAPTIGFVDFDADSRFVRLPGTVYELNGIGLESATDPGLFSVLGAAFGGVGSTFQLPRLTDTLGIGEDSAGVRFGKRTGARFDDFVQPDLPLHDHALEEGGRTAPAGRADATLSVMQESLAWNWLIATDGVFPERPGPSGDFYTANSTLIGEVRPFLGVSAPTGWAAADGALLDPATNPVLFALLGTTYGGDGRTSFALPDLTGRTPVGAGRGRNLPEFQLGEMFGEVATPLTAANLPVHTHPYSVEVEPPLPPSGAEVPLPAPAGLLAAALGALARLRRRRSAAAA
ncbi:MAG: tail fiber protein [Pseudomonadota bacterium]